MLFFFMKGAVFFYKKVLFFIIRCCFTRTSLIRHWFVRSKAGDCHLTRVEITGAGERKITDCRVGWLQVWKPARLQFEPIVRLAWTSKQLLNCLVRAAPRHTDAQKGSIAHTQVSTLFHISHTTQHLPLILTKSSCLLFHVWGKSKYAR